MPVTVFIIIIIAPICVMDSLFSVFCAYVMQSTFDFTVDIFRSLICCFAALTCK